MGTITVQTVGKWRHRFFTALPRFAFGHITEAELSLTLLDKPRTRRIFDAEYRRKILAAYNTCPDPQKGVTVAKSFKMSRYAVWRIVREERANETDAG
jgi:hypothetical protein